MRQSIENRLAALEINARQDSTEPSPAAVAIFRYMLEDYQDEHGHPMPAEQRERLFADLPRPSASEPDEPLAKRIETALQRFNEANSDM